VRSARTSDAALLKLLDGPAFAFSGANPKALKPVKAKSGALLLSYDNNAGLYHRASDREAPHNVFTSTKTLLSAAIKQDKSLHAPPALFSYGAGVPAAASAAKDISLKWSTFTSAAWSWSGSQWVRTQNGTPDVLVDHKRVSATNVVVMRIKTKATGLHDVLGSASPDDVVTGSGKVWVFRDGKVITGTWKRPGFDASMTLVAKDGSTIKLAPGNTWVELLPKPGTLKY
jgi:hypothetical protein